MKSTVGKKVLNSVFILLIPVSIGFMDWKYFFPLSAHADLRFQTVGESIELLAFAGVFALIYFAFKKERREGSQVRLSEGKRALIGTVVVVTYVAMGWREFFPKGQFTPLAGIDVLGCAVLTGLLMGFFSGGTAAKPSREEEKSVV